MKVVRLRESRRFWGSRESGVSCAALEHRKGGEHALDPICDSLSAVGGGIGDRPHDGRSHSYPSGHRHRRGADPGYSRTKTSVTI